MRHALARFASLTLVLAAIAPALGKDLPQRTDLVTGSLNNGMHYMVLQHATPPGRAAVWMHISSGSINESEEQRGLAHFLEHMAFNGSKNFEKNEVVAFFESMGLTFGQHQNAFTSFDQTVYQLALPDNKPESLTKAFTFFSDVLYSLSLEPDAIDGERQIILEEKRRGMGPDQRVFDYIIERMLPGSRFAKRLPIGTTETILAVDRNDFLAYYTTFYRPANATMVVVADMDPAVVVAEITKAFENNETAPAPADLPADVRPYDSPIGIVATDPELTQAEVELMRIMPVNPPVRTEAQMRDDLVDTLAGFAFNRRMAKTIRSGDVDFLRARAGVSDLFRSFRQVTASASGEPAEWKPMFEQLVTEVRRATLHGFSASEIDDARSGLLSFADISAEREPTAAAGQLLWQLTSTIASEEPAMSAAQRRDLMQALVPTITNEEINARFASLFTSDSFAFVVTMPTGDNVPTDDQVLALGTEFLSLTPEPLEDATKFTTILDAMPTPGTFTDRSVHDATDIETAWLANGIAVHHRFMDYKKDSATITITLAGGVIEEAPNQRGLTDMATLPMSEPASRSRSSNDINDLMVGKKASVRGGFDKDTVSIRISGHPDDLEAGLQVAYLLLTEPLVEPVQAQKWMTLTTQSIDERKTTPQGTAYEKMVQMISPDGEQRLRLLERADLARLSVADAQAWIDRIVREAPIEVAVVGDIDESRALELVRTYLGGLPNRPRMTETTMASLRNIDRPVGPLSYDQTIATKTPVAMVMVGCFGPDWTDVEDRRLLTMASRILNTRMIKRIREQEQLVYGIGVRVSPGIAFRGYGTITAGATTEPEKATRLAEVVNEMMAEFAANGPTEEEMQIVRGQIENQLDEQMREPSYWEFSVADMNLRGTDLDDVNAGMAPYDAYTATQVRDVVSKYYRDDSRFSVIVRPDAQATAGAGSDD